MWPENFNLEIKIFKEKQEIEVENEFLPSGRMNKQINQKNTPNLNENTYSCNFDFETRNKSLKENKLLKLATTFSSWIL